MKSRILLLVAAFILSAGTAGAASPIPVKGQGTADHDALFGGANKDVKWVARRDAIRNAINSAISNQSESLREQFRSLGDNFSPDDFEKKGIIKEKLKSMFDEDKKTKTVTAFFNGLLDVSALRDELNALAARGGVTEGASGVALSKDKVAVFFTARLTSENVKFDAKVTKSETSQATKDAEASQKATDDGLTTSEATLRQKQVTVGGSTTVKAEKQKYEVDAPSRELFGSGLLDRASSKGFNRIVGGETMESSADLDLAYGEGNVIPAKIYKKVAAEVRERSAKIKNIIIGTLDFSAPSKDPATGQPRVLGTVSGKVYGFDEDGELEVVAALKGMSKTGVAASEQDARKQAIELLTEEAMDEIITKMSNKKRNE